MKKHPPHGTYFDGEKDRGFNIESMRKYLIKKPELDKALERMIAPYLIEGAPKVLDACCGIGHLSYHLHQKYPNADFFGIDETSYLITEAQQLSKGTSNIRFETADLLKLPEKYPKTFDISICWKTLTWLPGYEDALRALFAVTRKHVFISSLFYEGDIDYEIKVREYKKERAESGTPTYHNIYSIPRFERFVRSIGAKKIIVSDFEIHIDLPRGNADIMSTYTVSLQNGGKMQMSGALPMPWKIIHIAL